MTLDPDPLYVAYEDGFAHGLAADQHSHLPLAILAAMSGAVIGVVLSLVFVTVAHASSPPSPVPYFGAVPTMPETTDVRGALHPGNGRQVGLSSEGPIDITPTPAVVSPSPAALRTKLPSGSHILRGIASYCAPTPRYCRNWAPPALLGAVPTFRYGDRPYYVTVWHGSAHVRVLVVSYCACGDKVIDLSPAAFSRLGLLSRGVLAVTVRW